MEVFHVRAVVIVMVLDERMERNRRIHEAMVKVSWRN